MNREELIKALKDWKPELELLAKYNDNSIDYQRYNAIDETIKILEQIPDLKEAYNKGYKDGQEALAFHLELCNEEAEPCEDCISRTQAIKAMDELENEDIEAYGCSIPEGFDGERARQAICLLPSIQPKARTGHWIYKTMKGQFCSACDEQSIWKFNYCPNCGAKMESEVNNGNK